MTRTVDAFVSRVVKPLLAPILSGAALGLGEKVCGEDRLQLAAHVGGQSHEEMRVIVLEFLDTDVFHVSNENCVAFIDPIVESWDVDLNSFRIEIKLNRSLVADPHRTFTFVESTPAKDTGEDPGLADFLKDPQLSGGVTDKELQLLRQQRLCGRRPNKLYYYRALQNLRDPLHFREK